MQVIGKTVNTTLIFGPGEAKTELKKAIERAKTLKGRIRSVEAVDKMTKGQIVAKVREYFKKDV